MGNIGDEFEGEEVDIEMVDVFLFFVLLIKFFVVDFVKEKKKCKLKVVVEGEIVLDIFKKSKKVKEKVLEDIDFICKGKRKFILFEEDVVVVLFQLMGEN